MSIIWPTQDPKYGIKDNKLCVMATGKPIPNDEPVFLFRAQDRKAVPYINGYGHDCENDQHQAVVMERVFEFKKFEYDHPERMKEPDTEKL